jgi:hypothetical protein
MEPKTELSTVGGGIGFTGWGTFTREQIGETTDRYGQAWSDAKAALATSTIKELNDCIRMSKEAARAAVSPEVKAVYTELAQQAQAEISEQNVGFANMAETIQNLSKDINPWFNKPKESTLIGRFNTMKANGELQIKKINQRMDTFRSTVAVEMDRAKIFTNISVGESSIESLQKDVAKISDPFLQEQAEAEIVAVQGQLAFFKQNNADKTVSASGFEEREASVRSVQGRLEKLASITKNILSAEETQRHSRFQGAKTLSSITGVFKKTVAPAEVPSPVDQVFSRIAEYSYIARHDKNPQAQEYLQAVLEAYVGERSVMKSLLDGNIPEGNIQIEGGQAQLLSAHLDHVEGLFK